MIGCDGRLGVPGLVVLGLVAVGGCGTGETPVVESELSAFVEDSLISGQVLENTTACEVDADCLLRIEFADMAVVAIYGTGERPAPDCSIPVTVSDMAFGLAPGDTIDVVLTTCGDEGYYLRRLDRRADDRPDTAPTMASGATCDGASADPLVTELRDRLERGELARFAGDHFGARTACEGLVTTEFDGRTFGIVRLTYPQGVSLSLETMPPETSIVVLTRPDGFDADDRAIAALRRHAKDIGLRIDWEAPPEQTVDGDKTIHTFWDPDSGLNASASVVRVGESLRSLRLSMAL